MIYAIPRQTSRVGSPNPPALFQAPGLQPAQLKHKHRKVYLDSVIQGGWMRFSLVPLGNKTHMRMYSQSPPQKQVDPIDVDG